MSRPFLLGLALLFAVASPRAGAETCSSSTLASADFAVARWCGDPPGAGTLRVVRRDGRAEEFLQVPLDTFREVVRTPKVGDYVAGEVASRYERGAVWMEPRPIVRPPAARTNAGREASSDRRPKLRAVVAPGRARGRASRREVATGKGHSFDLTAAERRAARRRAALRRTEARG